MLELVSLHALQQIQRGKINREIRYLDHYDKKIDMQGLISVSIVSASSSLFWGF